MAEANKIVAFPGPKITFDPIIIDVDQSMQLYDDCRAYVRFALALMTKPQAEVRAISDRREADVLDHLLAAFEECAESFAVWSEIFSSAHARLTAAKAKLV
jgi:hypothetical protein